MERWKTIPDFPDYSISDRGRVCHDISIHKRFAGRFLKGIKSSEGYLQVTLYRNGIGTVKYVHLLVAHAFVHNPAPERLPIVLHKDNNKSNPDARNLVWGTISLNAKLASGEKMIRKFKLTS
jgi:hypothetical protein